ncbi:hypothetical protein F4212_15255 [Candidatus Poribacteria bacterium]|nr:hypothetical protein [Candidatus Poribacteria bacterium]
MRLQRLTLCCLLFLLPTLTHAKIVFKSSSAAGSDIYVMDDDGRNAKILVKRVDGRSLMWPAWSPNGEQIAFLQEPPGAPKWPQKFAIYIIESDGTGEFQVTDGDHNDATTMSWSPDGKYLAFTSDRLARMTDAWTVNIATKALRRLTRTVSLTTEVTWSPDGKYMAYRDNISGHTTIHLMRADGSGQHELVKGKAGHWRDSPSWSVDSQSVVYYERNGHSEKVVIHNIKHNRRQVVDTPANWSIHGACFMGSNHLLISAKGLNGNPDKYDIYRYHLVTGKSVNLTNTPTVDDYMADWISDDVLSVSPQGKKK